MNERYLWDKSGEPNAEIEKLETALARFRHNAPMPSFAELAAHVAAETNKQPARFFWIPRFAAAAVAALAIAGAAVSLRNSEVIAPTNSSLWSVTPVAGISYVDKNPVALNHDARLRVGEWLTTSKNSRASITIASVGQVDIDPETRVRVVESAEGRKRIALAHGTIHAAIWAPPGEFVVDTPSAIAVDLGCMYTLQVDEAGNGSLRTTLGWVGFRQGSRESFIPAGAVCPTKAKEGPGTPYFEDASEEFRAALFALDFGSADANARNTSLEIVLKQARARDGLTLWHLLSRFDGGERNKIYEGLAALVPPPAGVTREGILQLDTKMLDAWWNALDLGDISLWRHWERSWSDRIETHK